MSYLLPTSPPVSINRTTWGRDFFEVHGSSDTYTVLPELGPLSLTPSSCTCPAFVYSLLSKGSQAMVGSGNNEEPNIPITYFTQCKHILAVYIARALKQYNDKNIDEEELYNLINKYI